MNALALVLLLAQAPAESSALEHAREFRAGGGAMTFLDVDGVAAAGEVGLEFERWAPLALRFTFGTAMRVGWGSVYFAPELVYRVVPRGSRASPYLAAGVQAAVLNFTDEALGAEETTARVPGLREARSAASGEPTSPELTPGGGGPSPLKFSAGPQAAIGVAVPMFGTVVDLGLRYNLHFWEGDAYSGLSLLLTLVGPAPF